MTKRDKLPLHFEDDPTEAKREPNYIKIPVPDQILRSLTGNAAARCSEGRQLLNLDGEVDSGTWRTGPKPSNVLGSSQKLYKKETFD